jgi:multiple antibiotic resistance protein
MAPLPACRQVGSLPSRTELVERLPVKRTYSKLGLRWEELAGALALFPPFVYSNFMDWLDPILKQLISLKIFVPFIPLFVAFNVLGILPIFVSLTSEMAHPERKKVARQSILTGFLVSIGFLGAGKWVFALLGITVSDFQIAGGILLFIIAIVDLIFPEKTRSFPKETMGVVPIGIPLIVGPAVLTLLLMIVHTYGYFSTLLCLILNLLVVWVAFDQSNRIMGVIKEGGAKGVGKVSSLLLAAFAMMMVRMGIEGWMGLVP